MERTAVVSSNLRGVGYDPTTQVLEVEFQNGGVYQYHGVPPAAYRELLAAPSLGSYFAHHIRNAYFHTKLS